MTVKEPGSRSAKLTVLILVLSPVLWLGCLLFGASGIGIPGSDILTLRLNRALAGFVVGAGLSCAGVVLQALLKNPLAEPYVLGVSSGAALGAAIAILSGFAASGMASLPLAAFVFAVLTLLLVYKLASQGGPPSVYSLILSGVVVSAMCSAVLMFLVSTASSEQLHSITWWMLGDLQVTSTGLLYVCSAVIVAGIAGSLMLSRDLNALTLGREMAHYVGVRASVAVSVGLALATLLTAAAVSVAGLIGFVGLIVPHACRRVVGADHRRLVPFAALTGGLFLSLSDAFARSVLHGREIPVGVITALLGGPFFLILLRRRRKQDWTE